MAMTSYEKALLAAQIGQGIAGGVSSYQQGKQSKEQVAAQQRQQDFQNVINALSGQQGVEEQLRQDYLGGKQSALNAMPLGGEQQFAQKQALLSAILPQLAGFKAAGPTSSDIAGTFTPQTNFLSKIMTPEVIAGFGPQATERSIADRRKAILGVDPTAQFGSTSDYGLSGYSDAEVEAVGQLMESNQALTAENIRSLAAQKTQMAQQQQAMGQQQQEEQKKKSSIWKKIGKAAIIGGAVAATIATGGAGAPLIAAAAGAGTGAIDGGWKGALVGAGTGYAGGLVGGLAPGGSNALTGLGGSGGGANPGIGQALQTAFTNPRTIAQMGSQFLPENIAPYASLGANFLPGPTMPQRTPTGGGPQMNSQALQQAIQGNQFPSGPAPSGGLQAPQANQFMQGGQGGPLPNLGGQPQMNFNQFQAPIGSSPAGQPSMGMSPQARTQPVGQGQRLQQGPLDFLVGGASPQPVGLPRGGQTSQQLAQRIPNPNQPNQSAQTQAAIQQLIAQGVRPEVLMAILQQGGRR